MSNPKATEDLTGQGFHFLTELARLPKNPHIRDAMWLCKCVCGVEIPVRSNRLRTGRTKSCVKCSGKRKKACVRLQDLTGLKFGRLTVLSQSNFKSKSGANVTAWRCQCSCMAAPVRIVQGSHLRHGTTLSCGCLRKRMEPITRKYLPGPHFVMKTYKRSAAVRNLEWTLVDSAFNRFIASPCYYCGCLPAKITTPPHRKPVDFSYNGIDRIDSLKGYTPHNVVPCCTQCNYSKRNYSQDEFLKMCRLIAERHPRTEKTEPAVVGTAGASAGLLY